MYFMPKAERDCSKGPTCEVIIIKASHVSGPKPSESSILTRLHAGYFRISLSLSSHALLWKILMTESYSNQPTVWQKFHKLPSTAFLFLWGLAILTQLSLSLLYLVKCFFHFPLVKAEFFHHIGVNFLYAPWISWLLLLKSSPVPVSFTAHLYPVLCWVFAIPILILDLKLYGQWFTTEKKFLSSLANPASQMSVLANLAVAIATAQAEHKEGAIYIFSLGMVHYLVLFVTLYQRLSGSASFPAILRPEFFLFFAAPSMASLAWNSISGTFDMTSKMLFFLSLFLFMSLACRPSLFKKSTKKFNVAWWAYSFPLTVFALASAEYAKEVKGHAASGLMLLLSALSFLVLIGLMLLTALNIDRFLYRNDPMLSLINNSRIRT